MSGRVGKKGDVLRNEMRGPGAGGPRGRQQDPRGERDLKWELVIREEKFRKYYL